MKSPVILDFDHSVGKFDGSINIDLTNWQDAIRYATSLANFQRLEEKLQTVIPEKPGTVFLGSGDYHHVSQLLIKHQHKNLQKEHLTVIVIDNHPDNMRYPFGIHCGSWMSYAAALPFVDHVHVVGITSHDIGIKHAIENRLKPLIQDKLTYWSTGVDVGWASFIGLKSAFQTFANVDDMMSAFISTIYKETAPVYLSIDKDALSAQFIHTNWDQGAMEPRHLSDLITNLGNRLIGCDVTGEVSNYVYKNFWKRLLSKLDGQSPIAEQQLIQWQSEQQRLNEKLITLLSPYL
ncbi:arginase family protein [uncultured Bartonella sp.]|uniref:arginase family protein n=1 Tax=uncultured Bartonella sp. TaxID=104108 RepID=UPI002636735E|nr:arginase family protein [uncultured Bartonella sp.]